jgi:hypothetical protein
MNKRKLNLKRLSLQRNKLREPDLCWVSQSKFKELKWTKIKVEWEDGHFDEKEIKDKLEEFTKEGKVRYLPQDYVDQLCSEIGKNELERQIEDVIFQKIPPEFKATYSDFKSYKDAQLREINDKKERVTKKIQDINYGCRV